MRTAIPSLLCFALFCVGCTSSTSAVVEGRDAARPKAGTTVEGGAASSSGSANHGTEEGAPGTSRAAVASKGSRPIVVELFSSEGCSSCPPADAVLRRLSTTTTIPGARVLALELHVDYWNDLGWADPFSSAENTARQQMYAQGFGQRGVYTPQMVIDGHAELVGSREEAAREAIAAAAEAPKAGVAIARRGDRIEVAIRDLPAEQSPGDAAEAWLAVTEDEVATAVPRGENAGVTLVHGPVVRSLGRIGAVPEGVGEVASIAKDVVVDRAWRRDRLRAVVFVQRRSSRRIVGAGAVEMN